MRILYKGVSGFDLTKGKIYEVVERYNGGYTVKDDKGDNNDISLNESTLIDEEKTNKQHETPKHYDFVNPSHYKKGSKEVYEMMIDVWGIDAYIKHCEMCAFKYRMRLGAKPDQPIQRDLDKAVWYEEKAKELSKTTIETPTK